MTRRVLILVAVLALALAAAWWGCGSPGWSVATRDERATEPGDPTAPRDVHVEPRTTGEMPGLAPAPHPSVTPRAQTAAGARIHGRVTVAGSDAPLPEGSRVDAYAMDGGTGPSVRRAALDAEGRYEVRIEPDAMPGTRRLAVFAVLPGWAWPSEVVTVGAGEDVELDLGAGGAGGALRARVVDPTDRPVARLPLILTTDAFRVNAGLPLLDPDSEDPLPSPIGLEAVVETDADGRFEVRGLAWRPRYAVSLDGAWHVTHEGEGFLSLGEATLRARPGFVLEGLVTDAETRKVLEGITRSQEIRVGEEGGTTHSTAGARGQFRWTQAVPDGGAAGFDVVFRASARGFRPAVRTVRFAPDRWSQRVDVALERLRPEDVGRVRLLHALCDERGRPLPLDVTVWEVHGTNRSGEGTTVEYGQDGFGVVELPAGEAQVRIEPQEPDVGGAVLAWEGPVEVAASRTRDFVVPFPLAGSVLLRTTPDATRDRIVLVAAGDRRMEVRVAPGADHVWLAAVPVGTWRAWSKDRGRESAVTVDVVAGAVAEVTVPR